MQKQSINVKGSLFSWSVGSNGASWVWNKQSSRCRLEGTRRAHRPQQGPTAGGLWKMKFKDNLYLVPPNFEVCAYAGASKGSWKMLSRKRSWMFLTSLETPKQIHLLVPLSTKILKCPVHHSGSHSAWDLALLSPGLLPCKLRRGPA